MIGQLGAPVCPVLDEFEKNWPHDISFPPRPIRDSHISRVCLSIDRRRRGGRDRTNVGGVFTRRLLGAIVFGFIGAFLGTWAAIVN